MEARNLPNEEGKNRPRTLRELEILQQLGLNADLTVNTKVLDSMQEQVAIVGPSRDQKQLRLATQWKEVPREVQERVARRLTLLEAWTACLGGLCLEQNSSVNDNENEELALHPIRQQFRARVKAIEPLWRAWVAAARGANLRARRLVIAPTKFVMLKRLLVPGVDETCLEGVSDMPKLYVLDVSRRRDRSDPPLTDLHPHISTCLKISVLRLAYSEFTHIPACVLQLPRLMRLDLSYNRRLEGLPLDIGNRLSKLASLNIVGCPHVRTLPVSLLITLERNLPLGLADKELDESRMPLTLTPSFFEEGLLDGILRSKRYPKLVASLIMFDAFQGVEPANLQL